MKSNDIRSKFLNYFRSKGHEIVPSAPIVLKNDPTLMFTNSGMNQFKEYFLGYEKSKFSRIADSQKCLRVSGKHNDLDDVGHDTYHHTMFEMLGNWSFGDYFKAEAIEWAWEFLTKELKINPENLYATIFEGDSLDGTPRDQEAFDLWKRYLPEDRILNGDKKDNFWEMGEVGPCGPCSEVHIDLRSEEEKAKVAGRDLVNQDHPQVVEIWNLVFIQFQRKADKSLEKLPEQHVDTGMGFERLCMALQGKTSNYDTDVFMPIINKIEKISSKKYGTDEKIDIAIRVVADHLRALSFTIADGQLPSNNGAGYVIRRILRRASTYAYRYLNLKEPFIFKLYNVLRNQMGEFYPELNKQAELVTNVIEQEEKSFLRTLAQGLNRLDGIIAKVKKEQIKTIAGKDIFELYDTYGFPPDLSRIVAEENDLSIDEKGFEAEMQKQIDLSKEATTSEKGDWNILNPDTTIEFVGYDNLQAEAKLLRYRKVKDKKGEYFQLVFSPTPFYAEGGGQIGDQGVLEFANEQIQVVDTKKENNLVIHWTKSLPQSLESSFLAKVDESKRTASAKNHTATHLMHEALRKVLGNSVEQRGSYLDKDYLRFDFSFNRKVEANELEQVETLVNEKIAAALPLEENRTEDFETAKQNGVMALFGEKYGDKVRSIRFGSSYELCGGTHVGNSQEIRLFKITNETSVAAGIRRVEAITDKKAMDYLLEKAESLNKVNQLLGNPENIIIEVEQLKEANKQLQKQLEQFKKQAAQSQKEEWKKSVEQVNGIDFLKVKTDLEPALVKDLLFQLKQEYENHFFIVGSDFNTKPTLSLMIGKKLNNKGLKAGIIIRELAKEIQGGGGGQDFFATAGGKNTEGLENALNKAKSFIE